MGRITPILRLVSFCQNGGGAGSRVGTATNDQTPFSGTVATLWTSSVFKQPVRRKPRSDARNVVEFHTKHKTFYSLLVNYVRVMRGNVAYARK
jgi:hypothetical protein